MKIKIDNLEIKDKKFLNIEKDRNEIEILLNGKKIFLGVVYSVDSSLQILDSMEKEFGIPGTIKPIRTDKINYILRCCNKN